MTKTHEIRTVQDILGAVKTDEQQKVFLADLDSWLTMHRAFQSDEFAALGAVVTLENDRMIWVDDDRPGECSQINVKIQLERKSK